MFANRSWYWIRWLDIVLDAKFVPIGSGENGNVSLKKSKLRSVYTPPFPPQTTLLLSSTSINMDDDYETKDLISPEQV
ncbi:hypothetical protein AYI68_g6698 [Smittium mucronatum]|uniref:Uncharacterized protein n=1 Tax=Smittium mucronatum TaxID=133383 RepID=A0A1R0GQV8_9FUNG|nr:hypothetical protein AYI68_g6698 [Smittium mucronatum]